MTDLTLEDLRRKKTAAENMLSRLTIKTPTAEDMPTIRRALAVYCAVLTMSIIRKKEEQNGVGI